jgi:vacuolar-type H+-ATPase subunit C/Vma6
MDSIIGIVVAGSVIAGIIAIAPTIKVGLDMAPYLYANTRCSARAGLILKKKEYDQLIASSSLEELYGNLEDSYYSKIIEHIRAGKEISLELEHDLYETYVWLSLIVPPSIKPVIDSMLLKFEITDLKNVMNACLIGGIPKTKYIEEESFRIRLESCTDLESFVAALKDTKYEKIATQQVDISYLSNQLDLFYYSNVYETIRLLKDSAGAEVFRNYWRKMIDIINVRLTLRKIKGLSNVQLIENGYINVKDLQSITDHVQIESILSKTIYKDFIHGNSDVDIETGMFSALRKESSYANAKHTLKAGTIMKFIIEKEIEIRNLNIIMKLKEESFKSEAIEKMII